MLPSTYVVIQLSNELEMAFMAGKKLRVREGQYPGFSIAQVLYAAKLSYELMKRYGRVPALRGASR